MKNNVVGAQAVGAKEQWDLESGKKVKQLKHSKTVASHSESHGLSNKKDHPSDQWDQSQI